MHAFYPGLSFPNMRNPSWTIYFAKLPKTIRKQYQICRFHQTKVTTNKLGIFHVAGSHGQQHRGRAEKHNFARSCYWTPRTVTMGTSSGPWFQVLRETAARIFLLNFPTWITFRRFWGVKNLVTILFNPLRPWQLMEVYLLTSCFEKLSKSWLGFYFGSVVLVFGLVVGLLFLFVCCFNPFWNMLHGIHRIQFLFPHPKGDEVLIQIMWTKQRRIIQNPPLTLSHEILVAGWINPLFHIISDSYYFIPIETNSITMSVDPVTKITIRITWHQSPTCSCSFSLA